MESKYSQLEAIEEQELLDPSSRSSDHDYELDDYTDSETSIRSFSSTRKPQWRPKWLSRSGRPGSSSAYFRVSTGKRRRRLLRRIGFCIALIPYCLLILVGVAGVALPSYSNPPEHYTTLSKRVRDSTDLGRANINNEKVYIAASLYDENGDLVAGDWGRSVLGLINMLGPDNVFLSVYENDPDTLAQSALDTFAEAVPCNSSVVSEHLDYSEIPHVITPDGVPRLKRIAYLAEVRNRALRPLDNSTSPASQIRFDKLLYINDIAFDPLDAANLLFSTNVDEDGKTQYRAACATDFINPFKFYDTFATRDLEGNNMGVPFFPWFTAAGQADSRRDVISQTDAVRVRSCWGGMVAFEAKWFQMESLSTTEAPTSTKDATLSSGLVAPLDVASTSLSSIESTQIPLRFRAETEIYWDGSECCLINADLQSPRTTNISAPTGIYLNPYIRVAYSTNVLSWLSFTKRFERLYPFVHHYVNLLVSRPGYNPRRLQQEGDEVADRMWQWDEKSLAKMRSGNVTDTSDFHGSFEEVKRIAQAGGFCGGAMLLVINEQPENGEAKWSAIPSPLKQD